MGNIKMTIDNIPKKWSRSSALKTAQAKYYNKNKEKIVAEQLLYNLDYVKKPFICECGDSIKRSGKYYHIRSNRHARRMENIAKGISAGSQLCNTKYDCECGSRILNKNKKTHNNSAKHIKYIKSLIPVTQTLEDIEEEEIENVETEISTLIDLLNSPEFKII